VKTRIAVSILDADLLRLGAELEAVELAGADAIHLDVMDGHFVANLSFGVPIGRLLRQSCSLPVHSHLMVVEPERMIPWFAPFSDVITFHAESTGSPGACFDLIERAGRTAGLALNPDTPVDSVSRWLGSTGDVLVMSVYPGKGGQQFMPSALERIRGLRGLIDRAGSNTTVSVDGGIKPGNCAAVIEAGADTIVAGSAVFGNNDYASTIRALRCSTS